MANLPKCECESCFANKSGRCMCLNGTDFGNRGCPFYKSKKEMTQEKISADCKAYSTGFGEGGNG
ncbi:MAG: hypothetical protein K6F35_07840 [Lachnospiraceae bacterium]|nr:hypothetical protein [Lachnospiraceae bacterium]